MIFNKLFTKSLTIFALALATVNFAGCKKGGANNDQFLPEVNPGDDFYTFANAEWFASLKGTDPKQTYGWAVNVTSAADQYLEAVKAAMPQYQALQKDIQYCEQNKQTSVGIIPVISDKLLKDVKTKEDAYVAYGKAIRLGINASGRLYTAINYDDNTIGYYFMHNSTANMQPAHTFGSLAHHEIPMYPGYTPTRGEKTTLDYLLDGIGLDPKYFLSNQHSDMLVASLEKLTVEQLVAGIATDIQNELLFYCGDEYVQQLTGGQVESVGEYVFNTIEEDLGYFTSYLYTQNFVKEQTKNEFKVITNNLIDSFRNRLTNNSWLTQTTINAAIEKLNNMTMTLGSPNKWPEAQIPQLSGELLIMDVLEIRHGRLNALESLLGKDVNEYLANFFMFDFNISGTIYPYICNASYNTSFNTTYLFAPFMMAPAYSADMSEAELYATVGVILAHEFTHGFDKEGALYDKYGQINDWWDAGDMAKFEALNQKLIACYNKFEVTPGLATNGEMTITEDVADLGGFNIAYDYWVDLLQKRGITGEELDNQKRLFFYHYAKMYAEKMPVQDMIDRAAEDIHSAGHIRVNGVVQHIDDWYELFDVTEGDALYLAPEERVTIW